MLPQQTTLKIALLRGGPHLRFHGVAALFNLVTSCCEVAVGTGMVRGVGALFVFVAPYQAAACSPLCAVQIVPALTVLGALHLVATVAELVVLIRLVRHAM